MAPYLTAVPAVLSVLLGVVAVLRQRRGSYEKRLALIAQEGETLKALVSLDDVAAVLMRDQVRRSVAKYRRTRSSDWEVERSLAIFGLILAFTGLALLYAGAVFGWIHQGNAKLVAGGTILRHYGQFVSIVGLLPLAIVFVRVWRRRNTDELAELFTLSPPTRQASPPTG